MDYNLKDENRFHMIWGDEELKKLCVRFWYFDSFRSDICGLPLAQKQRQTKKTCLAKFCSKQVCLLFLSEGHAWTFCNDPVQIVVSQQLLVHQFANSKQIECLPMFFFFFLSQVK